jgi:hypothetical protein
MQSNFNLRGKDKMANQVQNKPTAAYILSLLGGIFGILIGVAFLILGALAIIAGLADAAIGFDVGLGWGGSLMLGIGIWGLITSILLVVFAGKLKGNPMEHSKWGALILVFSLIGFGGWLAFIGGILALIYKPIPSAPAPYAAQAQTYTTAPPPPTTASQPITRFCPGCGRVVNENVKFCPHCGKALG